MQLYNTLTRQKELFVPKSGDTASLYTCGLTVYSQPHIGNWVAYIYWDILVRALRESGYGVVRVQNITDVGHLVSDADDGDDKLQKRARQENVTAWEIAEKYIQIADHEAYDLLQLIRPDHMPRATDYITQQIDFIKQLESRGSTYLIDGIGIYYDTSTFDSYGAMAHLDIEGLQEGARVSTEGKRHSTDFALWKFSTDQQQRDMEWDSPWGKGFPGWHLECSAMAREILGDSIDIHTGGIDHIPIHHTNEIAQSEQLTRKQFSRFWVHCNHMKVNGTKISKSLDNGYTLQDITDKGIDIAAFKMMVISSHYRTEGNFTWDILDASMQRWKHWQSIAELRWQTHDTLESDGEKSASDLVGEISRAMNDIMTALANDMDTPRMLMVIDQIFTHIENHDVRNIQHGSFVELLDLIERATGLPIMSSTPDIDDDAKQILLQRVRAREDKQWELSDTLRNQLSDLGIAVNDSQTTIWRRHLRN